MAWAALLTVLFSVVLCYLTPIFGDQTDHWYGDPGRAGLFGVTTLVAAWSILFVSKLTEGKEIDRTWRRLLLACVGVLVGTCAYGLDQALLVELDYRRYDYASAFQYVGRQPLLTEGWQPSWLGYALFFGALFGLRRWWWHVDTFRPGAFRISSLLVTVAMALLISSVWAFPHAWAISWAAAISCIVQLSAVWIPPSLRPMVMEAQVHGS
jgi:hypothetical protein